jgi:hypothetical protein
MINGNLSDSNFDTSIPQPFTIRINETFANVTIFPGHMVIDVSNPMLYFFFSNSSTIGRYSISSPVISVDPSSQQLLQMFRIVSSEMPASEVYLVDWILYQSFAPNATVQAVLFGAHRPQQQSLSGVYRAVVYRNGDIIVHRVIVGSINRIAINGRELLVQLSELRRYTLDVDGTPAFLRSIIGFSGVILPMQNVSEGFYAVSSSSSLAYYGFSPNRFTDRFYTPLLPATVFVSPSLFVQFRSSSLLRVSCSGGSCQTFSNTTQFGANFNGDGAVYDPSRDWMLYTSYVSSTNQLLIFTSVSSGFDIQLFQIPLPVSIPRPFRLLSFIQDSVILQDSDGAQLIRVEIGNVSSTILTLTATKPARPALPSSSSSSSTAGAASSPASISSSRSSSVSNSLSSSLSSSLSNPLFSSSSAFALSSSVSLSAIVSSSSTLTGLFDSGAPAKNMTLDSASSSSMVSDFLSASYGVPVVAVVGFILLLLISCVFFRLYQRRQFTDSSVTAYTKQSSYQHSRNASNEFTPNPATVEFQQV